MRLKARETLTYAGIEYQEGFIFDATEADAFKLINQDLAMPFGLEDPSTLPNPVMIAPTSLAGEPKPAPEPEPPQETRSGTASYLVRRERK